MANENEIECAIHPIDTDALRKGDTISREQIERIVGVKERDDPRYYDLKKLGLRTTIEQQRPEFDVCSRGRDLYIRTDAETVDATDGRLEKGKRDASRARSKIAQIDVAVLTDTQTARAEKLHAACSVRELALCKQQRALNRELALAASAPVKRI